MISTSDLLGARRYERARLLGALVTGRPEPMPGWVRSLVVGLILAGLLVGGLVCWHLMRAGSG